MPNSLTNALHKGYRRFMRTVAAQPSFYRNFCDPVFVVDPTYVETEVSGLATYDALAASPTAKVITSANNETSLAGYEQVVALTIKEANDIPSVIPWAMGELARLALLTIDEAFITALTTLDTTAHPEDGGSVYTAQGGGTVYYCDEFTVDPVNESSFNQANLFFDELDADALSNGLVARHNYKDKSGNRIDSMTKPIGVTSAEFQTDAFDLVSLQGPTYDGAGLRSGSFKDRIDKFVTLPGQAADSLDWWLIWPRIEVDDEGRTNRTCGIQPIIRGTPRVTFHEAPDSHNFYMKGYLEYGIHYSTWEGDIQMHSPNAS